MSENEIMDPVAGDAGTSVETVETPEAEAKPERARGSDGKFAPKPEQGGTSIQKAAKSIVDDMNRRALQKETDAAALDGVKPKGQDPKAEKDAGKGKQPTSETEPTSKDQSQKPDPEFDKKLDKAKKALRLQGLDEDDIAALTDEQVVALGKRANERQSAKGRELREAAEKRKAAAAKASAEPTEGDEDDDLEMEAIAREHFREFDDKEGRFARSLGRFVKAANARREATIETMVKSELESIQRHLSLGLQFELASRDVSGQFPKAKTPEGRKALFSRFGALLESDPDLDPAQAVEQAAGSLWAAEALRAEAARQEKLKAARQGAHSSVPSQQAPPRAPSMNDVLTGAVRKHMFGRD